VVGLFFLHKADGGNLTGRWPRDVRSFVCRAGESSELPDRLKRGGPRYRRPRNGSTEWKTLHWQDRWHTPRCLCPELRSMPCLKSEVGRQLSPDRADAMRFRQGRGLRRAGLEEEKSPEEPGRQIHAAQLGTHDSDRTRLTWGACGH